MKWFFELVSSSIGKKILMAVTGLFLILFIGQHLYGNLYLFAGEKAFNEHSESMVSNVFIRIVEIFLFMAIIVHVANGIHISFQNRASRPHKYSINRRTGMGSFSSKSMLISGSFIFIFIIVHLKNFFWEARFGKSAAGESLYQIVTQTFTIPFYAGLYIVAMILLGIHLIHGFHSALRTLGIEHHRYTPIINGAGVFLSIILAGGFASMPIYFFVKHWFI